MSKSSPGGPPCIVAHLRDHDPDQIRGRGGPARWYSTSTNDTVFNVIVNVALLLTLHARHSRRNVGSTCSETERVEMLGVGMEVKVL